MRKIINIFLCMVLVCTVFSLSISAKNETPPEITDEENDVTGSLINHPVLLNILKRIGIINVQSFEFMDVTAANFYENKNEPDFLYVLIRINNLEYISLRTIYAIRWTFDGKHFAAGCHTHSNGEFKWFFAGRVFGLFDNWAYKKGLIKDISDCIIDQENNLILLKIPKVIIGDPEPGDVLTQTNAWTGLRFVREFLTFPFGGQMAIDPTPYGNDYTILY